ncbi:MAG: hypothetical protein GWP14_07705 [Actinobacteria bacterium]|nr:hypothetical protein [Actinomycetota bacterium]
MKKTITPIAVLSVAFLIFLISGCSAIARKDISRVQAAHGVGIEITPAAAVADFMGGNSLVALRNVDKELQLFPYRAKKGINIHIGAGLDILGQSKTLGDFLSAPLVGAATQDRPGKTQGDIYVLNKDLWGTYMDLQQPGTTMWQDPHLRHEFMHAYEIKALKTNIFSSKWQRMLDQRLGKPNEMTHKLGLIDAMSLLAEPNDIVTTEFRPYVDFCARWITAMFGDVNADGRLDEHDRQFLMANLQQFDVNNDGEISYGDAAKVTGISYSFTSGINPVTQIEMTAGILGYRPKGFASPYGRTCPWEDKAEVLAFAIRKKILPYLYRDSDLQSVAKAYQQLDTIRGKDPVLARKIELLAVLFGNLELAENRNSRFTASYGHLLVHSIANLQ